MALLSRFVFIDVETTGMRPVWDRVIEIGILRVEDGQLVSSLQSLLNPESRLPSEITLITGITTQQVENAPTFREIQDRVFKILSGCIFVAHNARFDYAFVRNEFRRLGRDFSTKPLCTAKLSRSLFPRFRHHSLDDLIKRFSIECPHRHRALDDARVVFDFFRKIQSQVNQEKLTKTLHELLKKPSIPSKLTLNAVESLPERVGVYIFYGQNNTPLYVGKSINIKARVNSHFTGDLKSAAEMRIAQSVEHIEVIQTCGELGALLLESTLIKKLKPLYNRQLKDSAGLIAVISTLDSDGYQRLKQQMMCEISQSDLANIMGVFRSKKALQDHLSCLAVEYRLCPKLLGLENTQGDCFNYHLGRCDGSCLGKESTIKYNSKFWQAFARSKLQRWPFSGPVVITEVDPLEERTDQFVIDEWCLIGSSVKDLPQVADFDLDAYKILRRYIRSGRGLYQIRQSPLGFSKDDLFQQMFWQPRAS